MFEIMEQIWSWKQWTKIKWAFGAFLLWFILTQIWYLSTVIDYDVKLWNQLTTQFTEWQRIGYYLINSSN